MEESKASHYNQRAILPDSVQSYWKKCYECRRCEGFSSVLAEPRV